MKPSLRAPVLGSVTSLKLNHWLLERKNVHISGPPPPPPPLNRAFKTRSIPLAQCYVSWEPSLKPFWSQSSRTFGGGSSPSERRHLSHPRARPPRVPAAFESREMSGAKKLCTVSRCGGKGRGSGETGLRPKLSSESRKVCVRGAFNGRDSKSCH